MLTGLQVLDAMARRGHTLREMADEAMQRLPQVLLNVEVTGDATEVVTACRPLIDRAAERLGATGRVLVRPSGTEPLVRVMVEAADEEVAAEVAAELVAAVKRASEE